MMPGKAMHAAVQVGPQLGLACAGAVLAIFETCAPQAGRPDSRLKGSFPQSDTDRNCCSIVTTECAGAYEIPCERVIVWL